MNNLVLVKDKIIESDTSFLYTSFLLMRKADIDRYKEIAKSCMRALEDHLRINPMDWYEREIGEFAVRIELRVGGNFSIKEIDLMRSFKQDIVL